MAYKHWARIFNNDAALTTAILDRLVHHCETVIIDGKSYRSEKDKCTANGVRSHYSPMLTDIALRDVQSSYLSSFCV